MNAISSRSNDLGHIGPNLIKARSAERTAIPGPGNRNFSGFSLFPDAGDNVRGPIVISHQIPTWIFGTRQNIVLTFLNTAHTAHAHVIAGIEKFHGVEFAFFVSIIDTGCILYTAPATQASFDLKGAELRDRRKSRGSLLEIDMKFIRHFAVPGDADERFEIKYLLLPSAFFFFHGVRAKRPDILRIYFCHVQKIVFSEPISIYHLDSLGTETDFIEQSACQLNSFSSPDVTI